MAKITVYRKPEGGFGAILPQGAIENLIFEGGGPKGLVYVGAVEVLERKGILDTVRNVGGSSAGAMTALAVGLGFNSKEIRKIVFDQDTNALLDISEDPPEGVLAKPKKWFQSLRNLFGTSDYDGRGLYLGEKLRDWIKDLIARRVSDARPLVERLDDDKAFERWRTLDEKAGNVSFAELHDLAEIAPQLGLRGLAFTGTNYTDQRLDVFSRFDTPDMPISLAVRISASLPWFFKSVKYNGKEYMDGGCLENFPMPIFDTDDYRLGEREKIRRGIFDQNLATLGFKVDSIEEIRTILWDGAKEQSEGFFSGLLSGVRNKFTTLIAGVNVNAASTASDKRTYGRYAQRTVQIPDKDYSTFNFDLSDEDKSELAKSGEDATTEWFKLYYDDAGIEVEIDDLSDLADYLSREDYEQVLKDYPNFIG